MLQMTKTLFMIQLHLSSICLRQ